MSVSTVEAVLKLDAVCFQYHNQDRPVFSNFSLEIRNGAFVALVGGSGTGKTTLMHLLAGHLRPSAGACYMHGSPMRGPQPSRAPIEQEDSLWPWLRAADNVTLHSLLRDGPAEAASKRGTAIEFLQELGLPRASCEQYPKQLSVGMKKRVEIARALFAQPQVVLADEPFANVDPNTKEDLYNLVGKIWNSRQTTFVLATHDLEEAFYLATDIAVLRRSPQSTELAGIYENPFRGQRAAWRVDSVSYSEIYDRIRAAMRDTAHD